jgi:hypothetical protein
MVQKVATSLRPVQFGVNRYTHLSVLKKYGSKHMLTTIFENVRAAKRSTKLLLGLIQLRIYRLIHRYFINSYRTRCTGTSFYFYRMSKLDPVYSAIVPENS